MTGATGFLGRHAVEHLLQKGRKLKLAVRDAGRCPSGWSQHPNITIMETGELGPDTDFGDALLQAGTLVHLAGLAHVEVADGHDAETRFTNANAGTTEALVRAARASGVRAFVHLSSLAAITPNATTETIDDNTDFGAVTAYGRSKRLAERHVRQLSENGVFAVSLRPPLIVGADAKGNWAALQALARTGLPLPFASVRAQRSFIGVDTLCEAISLLCDKAWPANLSGDYCIADRELLSLPQLVHLLRKGMGKPDRLFAFPPAAIGMIGALTRRQRQIAGLVGDLKVDPSRFYQVFDFHPASTLRDAVLRSGSEYIPSGKRRAT